MTVADAVAQIRETLGLSQVEFAKKLGVTVTSISRYENGREPNAKVLNRLAGLSHSAGLDYLQDFFSALRRAHIRHYTAKLPTPGTARRVALPDLQRWTPQDWELIAVTWALEATKDRKHEPEWKLLAEYV